jgi:endonuclease/exonuclease/phosphatase family metal-dependent hydrolase
MSAVLEIDCLTWNVAQQTDAALPELISQLFASATADIISIALQEIELTGKFVDGNAPDQFATISSRLQSEFRADYSYAYGQNLGGVAAFLFFRQSSTFQLSLKSYVLVPHTVNSVTAGKASICAQISAVLNGEERLVTVIGSHLECREEEYPRRNAAWKLILQTVPESDAIILAGDLNYRIELPRGRVLELIDQGDVNTLLKYDQLKRVKRENPEFAGFREGKIRFLPTYKFDLNSDVYDSSPMQRTLSYTDRILISSQKAPVILEYVALSNRLSDHRPVRACFQIA